MTSKETSADAPATTARPDMPPATTARESPGECVTVIGEALADAYVQPRPAGSGVLDLRLRPGGSPANTAVALARLGVPTRFVARLARGPVGELLRDHLTASGVDLSAAVAADEPATLALTSIGPDGGAAYEFYLDGTADWQWGEQELATRLPADTVCVHTGSLALAREPSGAHIATALARARDRASVCIDPNVRPGAVPTGHYRARLETWLGLADILRLSEEDLAHLCPATPFTDFAAQAHARGVRLVVVTRGAAGALAWLSGTPIAVPAVDVATVDTVGAGDSFTAGLLAWLWQAGRLGGRLDEVTVEEVRQAVGYAATVAALTCAVPGADPPWAADVAAARSVPTSPVDDPQPTDPR